MAYVIPCGQCGLENRLGLLFCSRCGARLDMANRKPSRSLFAGLAAAGRWLRLLISLAFLAVLGLLCWPATPAGQAPDAGSHASAMAKFKALRGSVSIGSDLRVELQDAEISSYITKALTKADRPGGLLLHLREVRVAVAPGESRVWMRSELFSLPITYAFTVRVIRQDHGEYAFEMGRVHIGHAPLPEPLNRQAQARMAAVFRRLDNEITFLNLLPPATVNDGSVTISTKTANHPNPEVQP